MARRWHADGRHIPADTRGQVLDAAWPAGCGGAPRRNRTGDPILTMDRWPSAVLTRVLAGRAPPSMAKLWGQLLLWWPSAIRLPVRSGVSWLARVGRCGRQL